MFAKLLTRASCLLFPPECETCGSLLPLAASSGVCRSCAAEIKFLTPPFCETCGRSLRQDTARCAACAGKTFHFDRAYSCALYEGKMKSLMHAYKFEGRKILSGFFSEILLGFIRRRLQETAWDAVAAVPLDGAKEKARGFNQSELLSRRVSRALGVPHLSRRIHRKKSKHPQSLLGRAERGENVKNCFFTPRGKPRMPGRLLLIDDILTTGQTASECARTLKEAGSSFVTVLTLARGV